jgi:hypothetical protein
VVGGSLCALTWACARAEGESADPAQVEEVVVTAQRRQQNLQDVPISVTAASTAALAAAHVDNVSNIKALSPGVSFTTNYNTGLVKGAVNLPISDKAAFRIAGLWSSREGDFTNPNTDPHYNDHHATALKAQLLVQPAEDFDLRIIADWDHESPSSAEPP